MCALRRGNWPVVILTFLLTVGHQATGQVVSGMSQTINILIDL